MFVKFVPVASVLPQLNHDFIEKLNHGICKDNSAQSQILSAKLIQYLFLYFFQKRRFNIQTAFHLRFVVMMVYEMLSLF